jgi:3',5'-cyclic AMP phosphodiesterase CpdA
MLIAHISDTHFSDGPFAAAPAERARMAISRIQSFDPKPDCLVVTGDLADRGTAAEYKIAFSALSALDVPVHIVPGNHDDTKQMIAAASGIYARASVAEPDRCYYRVDYPGLRLFCCDSSLRDRDDGELGTSQLDWLDFELSRDSGLPAIIAMHHHPVRSGIAVMDRFMLSDADKLADVLRRHSHVVRILVGHVHRTMSSSFAGSVVTAAPSTFQQVFLDLSSRQIGAYVDEAASILLHHIDGVNAVTHVVPVRSGPPIGRIGG